MKLTSLLVALIVLVPASYSYQKPFIRTETEKPSSLSTMPPKVCAIQNEPHIFCNIEPQASIDHEVWAGYFNQQLTPLVDSLSEYLEAGEYRVVIRFQIDEHGHVKEARATSSNNQLLQNLVLKAMENCPNWTPSVSAGQRVPSYFIQPFTFIIEDNDDSKDSCDTEQQAPFLAT